MVNGLKFVLWQLSASIPETAVQSLLCAAHGEEKRLELESYDLPKSL
ncbi:hypothetical protein T4C_5046, partial [Trichinella pseudospiralis]